MSASLIKRLVAGSLTAAAFATSQPAFAQKTLSNVPEVTRSAEPAAKLTPKQLNEYATRGACWILHWHNGLPRSGMAAT